MKRATVIFIIGAVLFLGQRFFMIGVSYSVMGIPRLGDDAFFYVSKGIGVFKNYNHDTQLQKDIRKQISQQTLLDPTQVQQNLRAEYQAYGGPTVFYDLLMGAIYKMAGSVNKSFMISEIVVSLCMFFCFSYFFIALAGVEVAGFGLALLSLLFLPGQGIHYLIPSTLALSLGIAFIAFCLRGKRVAVVFLLSAATVMIHLMGIVWVCFGVCLLILRFFNFQKKLDSNVKQLLLLVAAALLPILIKIVLLQTTIYFSLPYATVSFPNNLQETVLVNLNVFIEHLLAMKLPTQLILLFSACNVLYLVVSKKLEQRENSLLLVFFLLLFTSIFVYVPFIPAEVSIRVFSAMSLFLILLMAKRLAYSSGNLKAFAGFGLFFIAFSVWTFSDLQIYMKENFGRRYVINSELFKEEINRFDLGKEVLFYLDTEYTFRQAVLAGLEVYPSYLYPLIDRQPNKEEFFYKSPTLFMFPVFNSLNTRVDGNKNYSRAHEYGLDLSILRGLKIESSSQIKKIYLKLKNYGNATKLNLLVNGEAVSFDLKANEEIWTTIDLRTVVSSVEVKNNVGDVLISGLHLNDLNKSEKVNWPWGEDVTLNIMFIANDSEDHKILDFSISGIFTSQEMNTFSKIQKIEALSDNSGIVVARIHSWL